jgi:hypothetical protein
MEITDIYITKEQARGIFIDFFIDIDKRFSGRESNNITYKEISDFIEEWLEKHFKRSMDGV